MNASSIGLVLASVLASSVALAGGGNTPPDRSGRPVNRVVCSNGADLVLSFSYFAGSDVPHYVSGRLAGEAFEVVNEEIQARYLDGRLVLRDPALVTIDAVALNPREARGGVSFFRGTLLGADVDTTLACR